MNDRELYNYKTARINFGFDAPSSGATVKIDLPINKDFESYCSNFLPCPFDFLTTTWDFEGLSPEEIVKTYDEYCFFKTFFGKKKKREDWSLSWVPIILWGSDAIFFDFESNRVGLNCHDMPFEESDWIFTNLSDCIFTTSLLYKIHSSLEYPEISKMPDDQRLAIIEKELESVDNDINRKESQAFMTTVFVL